MRFLSLVTIIFFGPALFAKSYIVKIDPSANVSAVDFERLNLSVNSNIPQLNLLVLESKKDQKEILEKLEQVPGVKYAEPDYEVRLVAEPNDKRWKRQYHHEAIGSAEAWEMAGEQRSVIVAVTDTGIQQNHRDLMDNLWTNPNEIPDNGIDDDGNGLVDDIHGWDFEYDTGNLKDKFGHGSHVAGIIGAVGNNEVGGAGIHWNARLISLNFFNKRGSGSTSGAIASIVYSVNNGARVINASWGGGDFSQALKEALEYARDNGVLFVAAAGNSRRNTDNKVFYPAGYDVENIIAVGSGRSRRDSYSNFGKTTVDLFAPGKNILSAHNGKRGYVKMSGTSMAAPMVSGVAALLWSIDPTLSWREVKNILMQSVEPKKRLRKMCVSGGLLSAKNAVSLALGRE